MCLVLVSVFLHSSKNLSPCFLQARIVHFHFYLFKIKTLIAELLRPEGSRNGAANPMRKRKPMNLFSHYNHGQRYYSRARTHDNDGDGVVEDGGHPSNGLTETCTLDL